MICSHAYELGLQNSNRLSNPNSYNLEIWESYWTFILILIIMVIYTNLQNPLTNGVGCRWQVNNCALDFCHHIDAISYPLWSYSTVFETLKQRQAKLKHSNNERSRYMNFPIRRSGLTPGMGNGQALEPVQNLSELSLSPWHRWSWLLCWCLLWRCTPKENTNHNSVQALKLDIIMTICYLPPKHLVHCKKESKLYIYVLKSSVSSVTCLRMKKSIPEDQSCWHYNGGHLPQH